MKPQLKKFFEEYIEFFEQTPVNELYYGDGIEQKGDAISIVGYQYHPKVYAFEKACYDLDLIEGDYMRLLEASVTGGEEEMKKAIESMDPPTLRAFLTFCIRGERFCDGFWIELLQDKIFARILRAGLAEEGKIEEG
jgi:hypothetical protein